MFLKRTFSRSTLAFLTWLVFGACPPVLAAGSTAPAVNPDAFPAAQAEEVGFPAFALERLSTHVQKLVDGEEIVGGELLVIKDRRTVLHQAFGMKDLETKTPLEPNSIYCVRSMTKPLVGAAVQMLIDEGRLRLDTPVSTILPSFDRPLARDITIKHLLTHTAGLPFTTLDRPLGDYSGLREVASEVAQRVEVEPGTRFRYSDAGSDTLGAVVSEITGKPVEIFIQSRILEPLGMGETFTALPQRPELSGRVPSAYSGGTGAWAEHWNPTSEPIFPFFLSSQSLYATAPDYARFLALWLDGGRVGEHRLLSEEAVRRALRPANPMQDYPRQLGDVQPWYGQQWLVHVAEGAQSPEVFGHSGSDGTYAWVWPAEDLMVLFFTQSRGTLAGFGLEPLVQTVLVDREPGEAAPAPPTPAELEQVSGLYWDETAESAYYVVEPRGEGLLLERPGRMQWVMKAAPTPGRFVHEALAEVWVEFLRGDDGAVTAMRTSFGGKIETDPKHVPGALPSPGEKPLPTVQEVVAKVRAAHGIDELSRLGLARLTGKLRFKSRGMEGRIVSIFDPDRQRNTLRFGSVSEVELQVGGRAFTISDSVGTSELQGARRERALLDHPAVRFGDWLRHYRHVEVLKRIRKGDQSVILVRVESEEASGTTMILDEESGRLLLTDALVSIPGMGTMGVRTHYADYRDVRGVILPFKSTSKFASDLIGLVEMTVSKVEVGVEETAEMFEIPQTTP